MNEIETVKSLLFGLKNGLLTYPEAMDIYEEYFFYGEEIIEDDPRI